MNWLAHWTLEFKQSINGKVKKSQKWWYWPKEIEEIFLKFPKNCNIVLGIVLSQFLKTKKKMISWKCSKDRIEKITSSNFKTISIKIISKIIKDYKRNYRNLFKN